MVAVKYMSDHPNQLNVPFPNLISNPHRSMAMPKRLKQILHSWKAVAAAHAARRNRPAK
jgi:hypothetical protein